MKLLARELVSDITPKTMFGVKDAPARLAGDPAEICLACELDDCFQNSRWCKYTAWKKAQGRKVSKTRSKKQQ